MIGTNILLSSANCDSICRHSANVRVRAYPRRPSLHSHTLEYIPLIRPRITAETRLVK